MNLKHIYWFAYFNLQEPSVRYRAVYPLNQLKDKMNISYSFVYPGYSIKNIFHFFKIYFSIVFFRKSNSLIVFQKIYSNGVYAKLLKLLLFIQPKNTLYDIDDADYTKRPVKTIHYFMKKCNFISVGSNALYTYAEQFNKNIFNLTSPVIDHGQIKSKKEKVFTIGWIGYYGAHRESLQSLFFPSLLSINYPIRLKLLGVKNSIEEKEIYDYFNLNKNIELVIPKNLNWMDERSIYEHIKTFDVGVSPLLDNEYNRAKSAFKLKQCLSCGIPVLASSIGENKVFLQNNFNGFFCDSPTEYFEKINELYHQNSNDYFRLSVNARNSFRNFSIDFYCTTLLKSVE